MEQAQGITVGAKVAAKDGPAGELTNVIVNPLRRRVTHVVVEERGLSGKAYLVPVERIAGAARGTVRLDCTLDELRQLPEFYETRYVAAASPEAQPVLEAWQVNASMAFAPGYSAYYQPYVLPPGEDVPITDERVPPGELSFFRGTRVESSDGHDLGSVEEFVLAPPEETITHFVVRMGRLAGARELALPVGAVATATGDTVRLKLTREEVQRLPAIAVRRRYEWTSQSPGTLELVAFVFPTVAGADDALRLVKERVTARQLPAVDAAVLTKAPDGKLGSRQEHDVTAGRGALVGAVVGGLLTLLAGPIGPLAGAVAGGIVGGAGAGLIDRGVPDRYLRDLGRDLRPGTSALVALIHPVSVDALVAALQPQGATVLRQLLTEEMVQRLATPDANQPV